MPQLTALLLVDNFNSETLRSIPALLRFSDLLLLLVPSALTAFYFWKLRKSAESYKPSLKLRLCALSGTIVLMAATFCYRSYSYQKLFRAGGVNVSLKDATYYRFAHARNYVVNSLSINGIVGHLGVSLSFINDILNSQHTLTDAEIAEINDFINNSRFPTSIADSIIAANKEKNVILIVVESLNAPDIFKVVNGKEVAPALRSLINAPGTVSALNIQSQIAYGGSGDGQLMANTGLLPLKAFSTSVIYGDKCTFPALPRLLERNSSRAVFADHGHTWKEHDTFIHFGFDSVYTNLDYPQLLNDMGSDAAMFEFAKTVIPSLKSPFFLELLSTSMHLPFDDKNIPNSLTPDWIPVNKIEDKYYRMLSYFDSALGDFTEYLRKQGIYDKTLLMIVSDHPQEITNGSRDLETPMAFIAANTGITSNCEMPAKQIDVFPTVLQLAGVNPAWKGVGRSLLRNDLTATDSITAQRISNLVIQGNFFHTKL